MHFCSYFTKCLQPKPHRSRNYLLEVKRRQLKYGVNIETVEVFWNSQVFSDFLKQYYQQHPDSYLVLNNQPVPNAYIDAWNEWKNQTTNTLIETSLPNLPYSRDFKSPYYPDMFNELFDLTFGFTFSHWDSCCLLFTPNLPKYHLQKHLTSITNFYSGDLWIEVRRQQPQFTIVSEYVNSLLDQYEYHHLIDLIIQKHGLIAWNHSQQPNLNKKIIVNPIQQSL